MRRALALALALVGCSAPTELIVVVDSNLSVPDEIDSVVVEIMAPDGTSRSATQSLIDPGSPAFPLTLGVAPDGETLGPIRVRAVGRDGTGDVVDQAATVTLVAGSSRVLRLYLLRSCVGRECELGTCGLEGCEAIERDAIDEWDERFPPLPDDPCLALRWDGDGDGEGSVACGGTDCADDDMSLFSAQEETCDDVDNNCDGAIDEGCPCTPIGSTRACQSSCMTEGTETCVNGMWDPCDPPDEVCNGIDDNCDGLTDEGFTYVATNRRAASAERASDPRIHWAGDRFVVAWQRERNGSGLYALTMAADGTTITPATQIEGDVEAFELASQGNVLAVGWHRRQACGTATCDPVRSRLFALDTLTPLGGAQQLVGNADTDPRVRVVWDGSAFAFSYTDGRETVFRRIDVAGMPVGAAFETMLGIEKPDVIWDGSQYRLVYRDNQLFMATGTEMGFDPPTMISDVLMRRPELAASGTGYLVAYVTDPFPNTLEVLAVDPAGVSRTPALSLSTDADTSQGLREREPGITAAGEHAVVTWVDRNGGNQQAYFARVGREGRPIQMATPLTPAATRALRTQVATDGSTFWVVWSEEEDPRFAQLARLECAAAP